MTQEEIKRRRKERKRKERARRHRKVIMYRIIALAVVLLICVGAVKGVMSIVSKFTGGNQSTSQEDSDDEPITQAAKVEDGFMDEAEKINPDDLDISDEMGESLYDYIDDYPQVKILLANRDDYPDELLNIFLNNQETLDFILDYPEKHGKMQKIDEIKLPKDGSIPLFIQWDEQWGYNEYGNNIIAISGCGPTSLAMVASGLLSNNTLNPYAVASFSQSQGYCTSVGTDWKLMSEGAQMLGLTSDNISLSEESVSNALSQGHPIICSMAPGDFTTGGHFIVLTGYKDGYVTVNDPNSRANSKKKWKFSDIEDQIKNLWAFSVEE